MTITKKPTRKVANNPTTVEPPLSEIPIVEPVAEAFIQAAEHIETSAVPVPDEPATKAKKKGKDKGKATKKKDKKNKEAVIIRFDDDHLRQIDASAEALGLSRAAWVRMVVAKALIGN